jgi:hypothetical protein
MLRLTSDCTAGAMRMACGRIHLSWRGSASKRSDKELAAVGVGAGVGHRERERAIVPEVAVEFVLELAAPANRFAQSRELYCRIRPPHQLHADLPKRPKSNGSGGRAGEMRLWEEQALRAAVGGAGATAAPDGLAARTVADGIARLRRQPKGHSKCAQLYTVSGNRSKQAVAIRPIAALQRTRLRRVATGCAELLHLAATIRTWRMGGAAVPLRTAAPHGVLVAAPRWYCY